MVKKIIALVLVLALSSVASAVATSIDIQVNGQPWTGGDVKPSDIITVTWVEDPVLTPTINGGFASFVLEVSNGDYITGSYQMLQTGWIFNTMAVVAPVGTGMQVSGGSSAFGVATNPDGIFTFEFHVPDHKLPSDVITIGPIGAGTWLLTPPDGLPSIELHVMPEPMTMALLGLGGLLVLRRRK